MTVKTADCQCGATVVGTGWITTTDGTELARCAVCTSTVVVTVK